MKELNIDIEEAPIALEQAHQKHAAMRVLHKLKTYGQMRKKDVHRGLETNQLAGLLTQKYGYGLCDAFREIFGPGDPCPTYQDVDDVVEQINPEWERTQKKRWASVAGLDLEKARDGFIDR